MNVLTLETTKIRMMQALADRDISEWRQNIVQQNRLMNALRQTQVEHSTHFDRMDQRLDRGLDQVDGRFDRVDGELGSIRGTLEELVAAVNRLADAS
jgi:hypothetical protein